jgi:tetratricopeptide (TPR) repeat protein
MLFLLAKRRFFFAVLAGLVFLAGACSSRDAYFAAGSKKDRQETKKLLELLHEENDGSEARFILIQQISNNLMAAGYPERLNVFLTTYIERNPEDPFNAYYLFIVAQNYKNAGAYPLAAHYYSRVLRNHPDILLHGQPVHLLCLKELVRIIEKPEYRINYYKELLARFGGQIDEGSTWFYMAKTYEALGEWEQAVQAYTNFLKYPDTAIDGYTDVHRQVMKLLAFHNSDKQWARGNLEELIAMIKAAIDEKDARALGRLRAGVNFFAMSWDQEENDVAAQSMFDLGAFLRCSRVSCARNLDPESNTQEAYLQTWGWSYRVPTWYLYFRKIHYPGDPEINGRWEWAGIYFGEKL